MKITKNFTLEELKRSVTARNKNIHNDPGITAEGALRRLCEDILQPLRDRWGQPIIVGSGYRCKELNTLVGGVSNSDHMYGCAADIHTLSDDWTENKKLFDLAVEMMQTGELSNVKQIIDEYHYNWIHIARQDGRSAKRNQVLHIR